MYFEKTRTSRHIIAVEVEALELVLQVVAVGVLAVILLRECDDLPHVATYVEKYASKNQKRLLFAPCLYDLRNKRKLYNPQDPFANLRAIASRMDAERRRAVKEREEKAKRSRRREE